MLEGGVWGGLEVCERVCERAARAGRYASRTPSSSAFIYHARFFPAATRAVICDSLLPLEQAHELV